MIRVIEMREWDDRDTGNWHYEARIGEGMRELAYRAEVNVRIAMARPESEWWACRGNTEVAVHEARKWAETQVREMAARAFAAHVRKAMR